MSIGFVVISSIDGHVSGVGRGVVNEVIFILEVVLSHLMGIRGSI